MTPTTQISKYENKTSITELYKKWLSLKLAYTRERQTCGEVGETRHEMDQLAHNIMDTPIQHSADLSLKLDIIMWELNNNQSNVHLHALAKELCIQP